MTLIIYKQINSEDFTSEDVCINQTKNIVFKLDPNFVILKWIF